MCFSAPASFTASAVLAVAGTALLWKVKNKHLIPLALLPYLFALQQLSEGVLWLYLVKDPFSSVAIVAKTIFLSFAFVVWPIWTPLSLLIAENKKKRRVLLFICLLIGIGLGIFLAFRIPHTQSIPHCGSIHYEDSFRTLSIDDPWLMKALIVIGLVSYAIATILPMFISSLKRIWILGLFVGIAALLVYTIDHVIFVSMWCFFAAIISISLFFLLTEKKDKKA